MPTPNPTTRRDFKGAAAATTLQNSMSSTDTSFVLVAANNWPSGSVGKFIVTVNRGQADEEKILCDTQTSRTVACLLANRGFDGTTAQAHAAGATVECTISAFDADEWNAHTNATGVVHGVAGSVVGTTDTQSLSNKTLDTATSSLSSGGSIVGTTATQSLTNKTLVTPVVTPSVAAGVAATLQGLTSQSGDYLQAKNVGATLIARVRSDGTIIAGMGAVSGNGALEADLRNGSASASGLVVTANAAQVAPLIASGPAGVTNFSVDAAGNVVANNLTSAWTSYTPTFTNVTGGAGLFAYLLLGKTLFIRGQFTAGTATAAAVVGFSLPASLTVPTTYSQPLAGLLGQAGTTFAAGLYSGTAVTSTTVPGAGSSVVGYATSGVIQVN